ncbi:hypothetical protein RB597_007922 [Gaeumannomyces tritici]
MSRHLEVILRGRGIPSILKTSFPRTPSSNTLNKLLGTDGGRKTRSAWRLRYTGPTIFRGQSIFLLTSRETRQPWQEDHLSPNNPSSPAEPVEVDPRNMFVSTTLVSTPSADMCGSSVLLHFENRRYLIGNVSEGTQRLMVQRGHSLAKMDEIMITGTIGTKSCGGLLGMILTIAGIVDTTMKNRNYTTARPTARIGTMTSLKLRGSDNLVYYLALGRKFILRQSLPVVPREILTDPRLDDPTNPECDWEDDNIKVWHVPLVNVTSDRRKRRKPSAEASPADANANELEPEEGMTDSARDALAAIVKDMFESQGMDALVETMLHDVRLPATVFVRGGDGRLERYNGPFPGPGREEVPNIPVLARRRWPTGLVQNLPRTRQNYTSMCYIVKPQSRRGKFDRATADKLGVPQTSFKLLCLGQNATAKDGTTVTPDMVLGAPIEGTAFGVFEVPNKTYIPALVARPEWNIEEIAKSLGLIYWNLGEGVAEDPVFLSFLKDKLPGVKHIVSSPEVSSDIVNFRNSASMAVTHNKLDPTAFPPIHLAQPSTETAPELPYVAGKPGVTIRLTSELQVDDNGVGPMDTEEAWNRLQQDGTSKEVLVKVAERRVLVDSPEFEARVLEADSDLTTDLLRNVEVVSLGTGSSYPSLYRNVSGTLLRVPGRGSYIFDCGENTMGQIRRQYGPEGAAEVLRDLRAVFVSHVHADHHMGLIAIIQAWNRATQTPEHLRARAEGADFRLQTPRLAIVATTNMLEFVRQHGAVEWVSSRVNTIDIRMPATNLAVSRACPPRVFSGHEAEALGGLTSVECVAVDHCAHALATTFTWEGLGLRVSYSGDCRPSPEFARIGRGSNLLIHEATFEDDMAGDALAKKHSTMGEALEVAREMGARRVLLTHFSQRYPKVANLQMYKQRLEEKARGSEAEAEAEAEAPSAEEVITASSKGGGSNEQLVAAEDPSAAVDGPEEKPRRDGGATIDDMPVLLAFDHMSVKLSRFRHAERFLPQFRELYQDPSLISGPPSSVSNAFEMGLLLDEDDGVTPVDKYHADKARAAAAAARKAAARENRQNQKRAAAKMKKSAEHGAAAAPAAFVAAAGDGGEDDGFFTRPSGGSSPRKRKIENQEAASF